MMIIKGRVIIWLAFCFGRGPKEQGVKVIMKHFLNVWVIVGLGFIAFGSIFASVGGFLGYRDFEFHTMKVLDSKGIVIGHQSSTDSDNDTTYTVDFTYKDQAEHKYSGRSSVSWSIYSNIQDGQAIDVQYLANAPDVYRLPNDPSSLILGIAFSGIGWLIIFIGGALLIVGFRQGFWINKLIGGGLVTTGTILRIEINTHVEINERHPRFLIYEYTDSHGTTHQGKSNYLSLEEEDFWKANPKQDLLVYYDPNKPENSHAIVEIPNSSSEIKIARF